ncbi:MAG TPA: DegT/DnrJ/EryC1/StrS family aminotransferase [Allosphingosinicella sp.]|nr:DegT/DnrJ/EryC1/StrS family aminotransferase [Allosphingosinicella sp.]
MAEPRIPLALPDLSGNEERYVLEALRAGWISSKGAFVGRFEAEFAAMTGSSHALAVCNGTSALHLALLGLGIGAGDEVIVPSLSFVATANAVRYVGAEPVFIDIDPATWCIDPLAIAGKVSPRTKAIIPVHLYGHPADMDSINAAAAAHGLWVVEDSAQAFGATYKGAPAGGLGHVGAFSFYGNKIITSGEGGAVTTDDQALHDRMALIRGQGMDPDRRYFFPIVGYNFRPTNIGCALLCAQIERAEAILAARRRVFDAYAERLAGVAGLGLQPVAPNVTIAPWLFSVTVDPNGFGRPRDRVMADLDARGIETRPFFIPIHSLPPYRERAQRQGADLPETDRLAASGLNLPTWPGLSDDEVSRVCDALLNP